MGLLRAESKDGSDVQADGHRQERKREECVGDERSLEGKAQMCFGGPAHARPGGGVLSVVRVRPLDRPTQLPAAFLGRDPDTHTIGIARQQGAVHAAVRKGRQQPDRSDPVQVDRAFAGQGARRQTRRRAPKRCALLGGIRAASACRRRSARVRTEPSPGHRSRHPPVRRRRSTAETTRGAEVSTSTRTRSPGW